MYEDFIKNPLLEIKSSIFNLQLDMTIEAENNIQSYLSKGSSKSKSKHQYSIQDFDISEQEYYAIILETTCSNMTFNDKIIFFKIRLSL